jgi:hypothetical protein
LFLFDKAASADLNNNFQLGIAYSTQLALLASKYTAHANIQVTQTVLMLTLDDDMFVFPAGVNTSTAMRIILDQFQAYFQTYIEQSPVLLGMIINVGVFISNNPIVRGGISRASACTTSGELVFS